MGGDPYTVGIREYERWKNFEGAQPTSGSYAREVIKECSHLPNEKKVKIAALVLESEGLKPDQNAIL